MIDQLTYKSHEQISGVKGSCHGAHRTFFSATLTFILEMIPIYCSSLQMISLLLLDFLICCKLWLSHVWSALCGEECSVWSILNVVSNCECMLARVMVGKCNVWARLLKEPYVSEVD
jgi:hypothetical protein